MAKHTTKNNLSADMPKDVKAMWGIGISIMVGASFILLIPALILLIAFPISLFVIAALAILLVGGYIKGKP
jgi:hypothetical protein